MKTKQRFQTHSSAALTLLAALLVNFATLSALAATSTWVGGYAATGTWNQGVQWQEGAFTSGSDVIFNNVTGVAPVGTFLGSGRTVKSITFNGGTPSPAFNIGLKTSGAGGTAANLTFQSGNTGITVASTDTANHTIGQSDGSVALAGGLLVTHDGSGTLTIDRPITGAFALTKAGTGTLRLLGTNTYSGLTTLSGGILTVGSVALQNSRLDTLNSIAGDANNGLKTTATTLTLGGLTGDKNLADLFTTTAGGYSGVTDLTLNPGSGVSASYTGSIADGAAGMTLTKSGVGTQILSGIHTYTGNTTINNGRLQGVVGGSCASSTVILDAVTATNSVSITDTTKGWTNAAFTANAAGVLEFNFGVVPPGTSVFPLEITGLADFTAATPSVRVVVSSNPAPGAYPLVRWGFSSGTVPTTPNLSVATLVGAVGSLSNSAAGLYLVIVPNVKANNTNDLNLGSSWTAGTVPGSSDLATWDSTVTAANTTALGADTTWGGISILNPGGLVTIKAGNTLTLGAAPTDIDMGTATADLTLNCALDLGAANVWNVAASQTLTVAGAVSGVGTLTKQGAGTVILSGPNTYTNSTTISAGTLKLGAANILPNGTGNGNVTVTGTLDLNTFSETINGLSGAGTVDNTAAGTPALTVGDNNASSTFSGVLQNTAGTLSLVKTGTGTLTLSGANTFSGTARVRQGTLSLANVSALSSASGITLGTNATLVTSTNGITLSAPITLDASGNNATISFSRDTADAGTLTLNGGVGGAGNLIFSTPNVNSGGNVQTILLRGVGTYAGSTTIDTGNANNTLTLKAGTNNALSATTVLALDGGDGAGSGRTVTFDLNGYDQTIAGLTNIQPAAQVQRNQRVSNSGALATLTINNSADWTYGIPGLTNTFSSSLVRPTALITGSLALTKQGAGTLTLVSANTYTGNTIISNGTLALGSVVTASGTSTGNIRNSPNIIVGPAPGSGAVLDVTDHGITLGTSTSQTLSGHGTVNGTVTVGADGSVAPGTSVGTLSIGSLDVSTVANGGTGKLIYELGAISASDKIAVTGTLTIGSGVLGFSDFVFTNIGGLQNGTYKLIASGATVSGALDGTDLSGSVDTGTGTLQISGSGTDLELVVSGVGSGTPSPTQLTNTFSGGSLLLNWPAGQGWRLQQQTNALSKGLSTNWVDLATPSSGSTNLTVDPTKPTTFYRLVYP